MMKVTEIWNAARDTSTVRRVYAEPYEKDGLTIIAAAAVNGGAGGGAGRGEKGDDGEGGGFGMSGRPAGAYVIRDGQVSWRPAIDPNRVVAMVGFVLIAYLLTRPRMARIRAKSSRRGTEPMLADRAPET